MQATAESAENIESGHMVNNGHYGGSGGRTGSSQEAAGRKKGYASQEHNRKERLR